ncbi:rhodanese-like domain-containing protein [Maribellus sp. YY47]|uniref:rhodanese-like domain-containing protein n=1 Tax=Maribellus sp. YY47 TaxID=2929486 RepID=UPI002000BAD3|nr:rhodanese-like domain-containing protein [Maribellus sp. YY47]MCK3682566.1 rhodanese-like domain-containing protein [Maribellus sp. YY47]
MNRNYIILTLIMLILAFGTLFLKMDDELDQVDPEILLQEIIQPTRYVTTDQVAKMIIKGDPSLMLIDVRNEEDFQNYSLPRSVNIPLDSLLNPENLSYLGIKGTKVVFVSDDDIKADQMWVLTKRLGYKGTYVMKGGLNCWMQTIIEPQQPSGDASYADQETYSFRKGAQMYFTGASAESSDDAKVEVQVQRREKSSVAAGGC